MKWAFSLLVLFLSCSVSILAQSYSGIIVGYSTQKLGLVDLNLGYTYKTFSFQYLNSSSLLNSNVLILNWEINPQFAITSLRDEFITHGGRNGYEAALLFGLTGKVQIHSSWQTYLGISIGPQYITNPPIRQKKGFIFSDNAFWGNQINVSENTAIDIRFGIRHQSNASITQPNGGIDSLFFSVGALQKL